MAGYMQESVACLLGNVPGSSAETQLQMRCHGNPMSPYRQGRVGLVIQSWIRSEHLSLYYPFSFSRPIWWPVPALDYGIPVGW